jgi:hypothetical protein
LRVHRVRDRDRFLSAPAFWSASGGVGWGWPHPQCRRGSCRISETQWATPGGGRRPAFIGVPGPRPSGPPAVAQRRGSAWSREGGLKDCDHADHAPAASIVAGRGPPERFTARVARHDIVWGVTRCRWAAADTMSSPARPGERSFPRTLRRHRARDVPVWRAVNGSRNRKRSRLLLRARARVRVQVRLLDGQGTREIA